MALLAVAVALTAAALTPGTAHAFFGRGDLNGDGEVDYDDVLLLQRHLTALEVLPETDQDAADLDGSGALTVNDLSLLIRRIEKTVRYQVALTSRMERVYYEPGEEIPLTFSAQVSHGGQIQAVAVNGAWYETEWEGESGTYTVRIPGPDAHGVHTLYLTGLRLHRGQEVAVDFVERVETLKAVPQVEGFAWERTDGDGLKVSFTLTDSDGTLLDGRLTISQGDGAVLLNQPLASGEHEGTVALTWREDYIVTVTADYDRDTGALDNPSNRYEGQTLFTTQLTLSRDAIQFKDVTAHRLYQSGSGGVREVTVLDVTGACPRMWSAITPFWRWPACPTSTLPSGRSARTRPGGCTGYWSWRTWRPTAGTGHDRESMFSPWPTGTRRGTTRLQPVPKHCFNRWPPTPREAIS